MGERPTKRVDLTHDLHAPESAPLGIFLDRVLERGLTELRSESWPTAEGSLSPVGDPVLRVATPGGETAFFERDGVLLQLALFGRHVHATAAAARTDALDETFRFLRERLRAPDPSSAHEVPVTFWTYSPHGPQPSWRSIAVPGWEEIRDNYSEATRASLQAIMSGFEPAHGGQLVLWHGQAGTGKTFALRALAWEWRDWCQFHYIVDPDSFFGQHADYLMSVLLQPPFPMVAMRHGWVGHMEMVADDGGDDADDARPWRVLVLEDTGELLTVDARAVLGQGLSRFLNVVDGLIGQGLRVLVLVTTNEEIRRLHPAVARPGRCAANIEFSPLSEAEANDWLSRHGGEGRTTGATTLAALYARLEGRDPAQAELANFAGGFRAVR